MFRMLARLTIAGVLLIGSSALPAEPSPAANKRKVAPSFSLNDSEGKTIKLADFQGKVVLLDFWATWCHGCMTEIPWFMEFHDKYQADGLAVIGVSVDDDGWKSVKPFLAERKFNYTIVVGNQDLEKLYSVEAPPVAVLIDREGKIVETHAGVVEKDSFEKEIKELLREGK
jgi:cytochrome c biogenesis protein CcmG/thiol:disulfide interchange protein DsbE